MITIHNWKRFWHLRGTTISLSDGGFLYDPDSEHGNYFNSNTRTLESICEIRCLILLGEPGIGKSQELQQHYKYIKDNPRSLEDKFLIISLGDYQTEDRLYKETFEDNPIFQSWLSSNNYLRIFLDGLDEALLSIRVLAKGLANQLIKYVSNRLDRVSICIACRTAEWPNVLETRLIELWGEEKVKVFQLCPLRKVDIIEAAKNYGLNANDFLQNIQNKQVVPLAIKPITLQMLINIYKQSSTFPKTQQELYAQGCLLLCKENNGDRQTLGQQESLSSEQKLALAGRMAAITLFTNHFTIWNGNELDILSEGNLLIKDVCGETESINCESFWVDENKVKEVLKSGLFILHNSGCLRWSHQTYLEYLAAWYLVKHNMGLAQIISLIQNNVDSTGKIVPQLYQVAAWLAAMRKDVFDVIIKVEPEVLLRSDITTASNSDKALLVNSILELFEQDQVANRRDFTHWYKKLSYPELARELKPYIINTARNINSRYQAIEMVEACEEKTLLPDLIDRATEPSEFLGIRQACVRAIKNIGDPQTKAQLKPLASAETPIDPEDEIKGFALMATWPEYMSVDELLLAITPPKYPELHGVYELFIYSDFQEFLSDKDLIKVLSWIKEQKAQSGGGKSFVKFEAQIMRKAWQYLDQGNFLELFTQINLLCIKDNELLGILRDPSTQNVDDDKKCHKILDKMFLLINKELIETVKEFCLKNNYKEEEILLNEKSLKTLKSSLQEVGSDNEESIEIVDKMLSLLMKLQRLCWHLYYYVSPKLVINRDVIWLIEYAELAQSPIIQEAVLDLIGSLINYNDQEQYYAILNAVKRSRSIFGSKFSTIVEQIDLDSNIARNAKEFYIKEQRMANATKRSKPLLDPPPAERIEHFLKKCEEGDKDAWWRLNLELTLKPDSTRYSDEYESDITLLAGWKSSNEKTKKRIMQAAIRYLEQGEPNTSEWLGTTTLYRPAYAGLRALRLVSKEFPSIIEKFPVKVWEKWAAIILIYPIWQVKDKEAHKNLVKIAYKHAPDEIIRSLLATIDRESKYEPSIYITQMVENFLDDKIGDAIFNKIQKKKLKLKTRKQLLGCLLKHNFSKAREYAESMMPIAPYNKNKIRRSRAIAISLALINNATDAGWPLVWPIMQQDNECAESIIETLAGYPDGTKIFEILNPQQLKELYIWLERKYPSSEDPYYEGVHSVGTREQIGNWRSSILNRLVDLGTIQACRELENITRDFPDNKWIKKRLLEAQHLTRYKQWVCPKPNEIIQMAKDQDKRLIKNGEELLDVVVESLKRLEDKLQGETLAAQFLWDEAEDNTYKPKGENSLSDFVKLHFEELKTKGIIVNREVEIRPRLSNKTGQETDIKVETIIKNNFGEVIDNISVIIETKGCWHQDLDEAMQTQLVGRYLKNNQCCYGLYLVGYYNCEQWSKKDYRKQRSPKISLQEMRRQFDTQASNLSQGGIEIRAFVLNVSFPN